MIRYGVIVHGGVGSPSDLRGACQTASASAFDLIEAGGNAVEAVVKACSLLEDDGRFNAGRGSVLRLDGKTIEMDAAVMDSKGNMGIVIAIKEVANPVLVARAVMDTPHLALSGKGATDFARMRGFVPFYHVSPRSLERHRKLKQLLKEGKAGKANPLWSGVDIESLWNFNTVSYREFMTCDTIGSVAIDKEGNIAVAASTGGASPMMLGRVGDTPMIGCGFYAGEECAVACTGIGEEIMKRMLAKSIYDMICNGTEITIACSKAINMFPPEISAGVIALSKKGFAVVSNAEMVYCSLLEEGDP